MAEKRPSLPLMLTAQDLRHGGVVYWGAEGWGAAFGSAIVARDEAAAAVLDEVRADPAIGATVIDPFLFTLGPDGEPRHYRERGRVLGPSFRNDFGVTPAGADRVPL